MKPIGKKIFRYKYWDDDFPIIGKDLVWSLLGLIESKIVRVIVLEEVLENE